MQDIHNFPPNNSKYIFNPLILIHQIFWKLFNIVTFPKSNTLSEDIEDKKLIPNMQ